MRVGQALVVCVSFALAGGCARKVVLDPSQVPARNDRSWTIRQTPTVATPIPATPATAPSSSSAAAPRSGASAAQPAASPPR